MPLIRGTRHSCHHVKSVPGMNLLCTTVCTRAGCNHLQQSCLKRTRKPSVLNQRMPSSASAHVQVIAGAPELGALVTGGGSIVGGVVAEVCLHTNVSVTIFLLFSPYVSCSSVSLAIGVRQHYSLHVFFSLALSLSLSLSPKQKAFLCCFHMPFDHTRIASLPSGCLRSCLPRAAVPFSLAKGCNPL